MNIVVVIVVIALVVLPIYLSDLDRSDWPRELWR